MIVFVDNVKIDKEGNAVGLDISEKGEYIKPFCFILTRKFNV